MIGNNFKVSRDNSIDLANSCAIEQENAHIKVYHG